MIIKIIFSRCQCFPKKKTWKFSFDELSAVESVKSRAQYKIQHICRKCTKNMPTECTNSIIVTSRESEGGGYCKHVSLWLWYEVESLQKEAEEMKIRQVKIVYTLLCFFSFKLSIFRRMIWEKKAIWFSKYTRSSVNFWTKSTRCKNSKSAVQKYSNFYFYFKIKFCIEEFARASRRRNSEADVLKQMREEQKIMLEKIDELQVINKDLTISLCIARIIYIF